MNKKQLRISLIIMGMFAITVICMGLVGGVSTEHTNKSLLETNAVDTSDNSADAYKDVNETIVVEEKK